MGLVQGILRRLAGQNALNVGGEKSEASLAMTTFT